MSGDPQPGRVTLIGAGPGDPGLITVKGLRRLQAADVVLYDRLVAPALLALARSGAELVDVGKRPGADVRAAQRRIERRMVESALAGADVVRLKGGDPAVFGRGGEEIQACATAGVPCSVVPGISSVVAAPAAAGIPLTHRGVSQSFAVVSARNAEGGEPDWAGLAGVDTVVVLMAARRLERIGRGLIAAGRKASTPAVIAERAATPNERVTPCTLAALAEGELSGRIEPPCVVIVGEVAAGAAADQGDYTGARGSASRSVTSRPSERATSRSSQSSRSLPQKRSPR